MRNLKHLNSLETRRVMLLRMPLRQKHVASILEVSDSFLSQWLAGKRNSQRVEQGFERLYKKHYAGQSEPA